MNKKYLKVIILSLLSLILLAGCATGPRAESTTGLAANESHLFVSLANKIYKVELETGLEIWRYPSDNSRMMVYAPVLLNDEYFTYGDLYNTLQRVNLETPTQKVWEFKVAKGWYQTKVAESDGVIVAPNTDRNVYGVNAKDGTLLWTHEDKFAFLAEPVIVDGKAIISSQNHEILWLDLKTGKPEEKSFAMKGAVISAPYYDETLGYIFVGSLGHEFVAIDAKTQKEVWRYEGSIPKLSGIWAPPIMLQGQLIFNDDLGNIISVDPKTGAENWIIAEQGKMLAGLAAIGEDAFIVALEDGTIRGFDVNRKPLFPEFDIPKGKIYTTPLVTDEMFIIAPMGAEFLVYAYPIEYTGMTKWVYKPAKK